LSLWQATTLASSRMQVTPSSVLPAIRIPGSAPCRASIAAQARRRAAFTAAVILPSADDQGIPYLRARRDQVIPHPLDQRFP